MIGLCQREVWIEAQCQFEFGERVVEAPVVQMGAAQSVVSPRILAVGKNRGQRGALGERSCRRHICPTHVRAESVAGGQYAERLTVVGIDGNRLLEQSLRNQ